MRHWARFDDSGDLADSGRQALTMGLSLAGGGESDRGWVAFDMSTESILRNKSNWEGGMVPEIGKQLRIRKTDLFAVAQRASGQRDGRRGLDPQKALICRSCRRRMRGSNDW